MDRYSAQAHRRVMRRAAQQIVGRERNHVVCNRQLVRDVVDRRRVNSNVMRCTT
jgi:hypothetical protein